ncbi:MAG: hypothetical protein E7553_07600 [Ruminococcaceae bacterium]|nr:hypothetical protein [Oscillospiraceae bacterium]
MKKLLCVMVAIVLCIGLCACGNGSLYAKVTYKSGAVETLAVGEIPDLLMENATAYNQKYAGQKIEVVDKIHDIGNGYGMNGAIMIHTNNGWSFCMQKSDPIVAKLRKGDMVKIVGKLTEQSVTIQEEKVMILE